MMEELYLPRAEYPEAARYLIIGEYKTMVRF